MALNRQQTADFYRPQSVKALSTGNSWSSGGVLVVPGAQVDFSVPLRGFRVVMKLRDVIGTAAMTSANPLGYFNLLKRIYIYGRNSRGSQNATLWDLDCPSAILIQSLFKNKPWFYNGVAAALPGAAGGGGPQSGTELTADAISTPMGSFLSGVTGTYDVEFTFDLPAYPFDALPFLRPGYYLRGQEWGDSLQIRIEYSTITNGANHALGQDAGTTTHTFTAKGGASGSPTVDVYALPAIAGVSTDAKLTPGFLSRINVPVTTQLQSAGSLNTRLLTLEKQNTKRVYSIVGVSTVNPFFSAFSDTNLTTLGMVIGSNKVVRENDDIIPHKFEMAREYGVNPIQGVTAFDFAPLGYADSHYSASAAESGSTLELRGTVAGVANALGTFIQEIEVFRPEGSDLYAE